MNSEDMWKAAHRMETAADRASRAADSIDNSVQRLAAMLEDGYGGNGTRLIELLEKTSLQSALDDGFVLAYPTCPSDWVVKPQDMPK